MNLDARLNDLDEALSRAFGPWYDQSHPGVYDAVTNLRGAIGRSNALRDSVLHSHQLDPAIHGVQARFCTDACRVAADLL